MPSPSRNSAGPIWSKKMKGPTICRSGEGRARRTEKPPRSRVRGTITVSIRSQARRSPASGSSQGCQLLWCVTTPTRLRWKDVKCQRHCAGATKTNEVGQMKLGIFALILLGLLGFSPAIHQADAAVFGTRCQSEFQNGWSVTLPEVWNRCGWFNNELDDTDTKAFYFNLHGARSDFTTCDECNGGPDAVHLLYVDSHGGTNGATAGIFMWDQNSTAITPRDGMRYGDENVGLAILAQYLCRTLSIDSGANVVARWFPVFQGGMIMATGSHDLVWDGVTTNETGEDFADDLQSR